MTNIEKLEKLKTMELSNLSELITQMVGYTVTIDEFKINKQHTCIDFESQCLKEHTGIMKDYYDSFKITPFGNGFMRDDDNIYSVALSFRFNYINYGGGNGYTFGFIGYNFETKKWYILN